MPRSTMYDLIALVRTMIGDPFSDTQQFSDDAIQERLDASRDDIRYENLKIAPSIVNLNSTSNSASTIFADYYSNYQWWEADVVLQGQGVNTLPWIVLTPTLSELNVGHWQFENNVFTSGTVPGQLPPVFATGKVYDPNYAAADLLEFWAVTLSGAYNISVDGQNLQRSQLMTAKLAMAEYYRKKAKPRVAKMLRSDVLSPISSRKLRLLDEDDSVQGRQ